MKTLDLQEMSLNEIQEVEGGVYVDFSWIFRRLLDDVLPTIY